MIKVIKKGIVFPIIILCALCVVNSSSGISQFQAKKGVQMKIVDSKNALISLPNVIDMDIKVIKQVINYYKLSTIYILNELDPENEMVDGLDEPDNQLAAIELQTQTEAFSLSEDADQTENVEPSEVGERKVAVEIKELINTEEMVDIIDNECTINIKNNLCSDIRLEKIEFDDPYLMSDGDGKFIGVGDTCNITITYNNPDIIDGDEGLKKIESMATLYFSWEKGKAIIYEDVMVYITIINKDPKNIIL